MPQAQHEERRWGQGLGLCSCDILSLLAPCHWVMDPPTSQAAGAVQRSINIQGSLFLIFNVLLQKPPNICKSGEKSIIHTHRSHPAATTINSWPFLFLSVSTHTPHPTPARVILRQTHRASFCVKSFEVLSGKCFPSAPPPRILSLQLRLSQVSTSPQQGSAPCSPAEVSVMRFASSWVCFHPDSLL